MFDESIDQVVATQQATLRSTCTPCARLIIIFGNLNQHFSPADWIGLYLPRGAMDLAVSITITPGRQKGLSFKIDDGFFRLPPD